METNSLTRYLQYQLYHARLMIHCFIEDKDGEYLHEFRVALRQTRSLVKLFLEDTAPFPPPLKAVISATNPIRELDVLMDSISSSEHSKLSKQLSQIRKDKVETLFTQQYKKDIFLLLDQYYDVISHTNPNIISEILIARVLTHYQHCLDTYQALKADAKEKELHRLRIAFKDARYGFEFLEISDIHECKQIIQYCKQMQNTLGAVQDAVNQIEWLKILSLSHPSLALNELIKRQTKALKKLKETTILERSPTS